MASKKCPIRFIIFSYSICHIDIAINPPLLPIQSNPSMKEEYLFAEKSRHSELDILLITLNPVVDYRSSASGNSSKIKGT